MNVASDITVLINAIRNLCDVGVCYYDLNHFFHYDKLGIKNNRGHYCTFCEKTRSLPGGRANCEKSDRKEAVYLATQYKEPFFFECHMGMKELVVPLLLENKLLGIIFVGQCRIQGDNHNSIIRNGAQRLGGDVDEMLQLYEQLPLHSQDDLLNI
jgi:ligand-binding sensor protein